LAFLTSGKLKAHAAENKTYRSYVAGSNIKPYFICH